LYGGGGGGAGWSSANGGNGAQGAIIITYTPNTGVNVNLVAASATGNAGAFLNQSQNVNLVAATASGAANAMAGAGPPLAAASATAAFGAFGQSHSVILHAVAATGTAPALFPTLDFLNVPLITIVNNKPIPIAANMNSTPIAMSATLPSQLPLAVIIE